MKSALKSASAVLAGMAAVAVVSLPVATFAQTATRPAAAPAPNGQAAATLPNAFDQAPARRTTTAPAPAQTPAAQEPAAEVSDPAKVAAAETMLKKTIAAMQAGTPNYADMTPDLAAKVREQAANLTTIFPQLGEMGPVTHVGMRDGAELFLVVFEKAPTQWVIAQNDEGKIVALLFRPAPAPEAPDATAAPATPPAS